MGRILEVAAVGAVLVGGIGFAIGFFGPMLFMPDANQGPLIGIFFTGPLGFMIGAIGGAVKAYRDRARIKPPSDTRG